MEKDLMIPRYEVIADYPYQTYQKGTIIDTYESAMAYLCDDGDSWSGKASMSDYPHLFKRLQWHERRKKEDMPEYIKWTNPASKEVSFFKIYQWFSNSAGVYIADIQTAHLFIKDIHPAIESEYNAYIKQLTPESR